MNCGDLIFSLEDNRLDSGVEWSGYAAEVLEQEMANFFDPQPDLAFNTTGVKPDLFIFNEPVDVTPLEGPEFSAARIGSPMFGKVGGTGLGIDGSEIRQLGTPVGYSHRRSARKIQQATDSLFGNDPHTFQFDSSTVSLPQIFLQPSIDQLAALNLGAGAHLGTPGLSTGPLSPRSTFAGNTPVFETYMNCKEEVEAGALFGPGNEFNAACLPAKAVQESTSITPLLDQFAFAEQAIPRPVTPIEQIAPSFDSLNIPSSVHSHCSHGGYQSSHQSPAHNHMSYPTSPFDSCVSPTCSTFTIPPSSSSVLSPYNALNFHTTPSTTNRNIPANFEFTYSLDLPTPTRSYQFAGQSSRGLFKRAEQNLPFIPYVPAPAVAKGRKKRSRIDIDMEVDSDDIQVPEHGRYPSELSVAGHRKPSAARSKSSPRRVSSASSTKSLGRPSKESQLQQQNFDISMIPNLHTKPAEYFHYRPWLLENRLPNIDEWRASDRFYKGYDVPMTDVDLLMSKGNTNNPAEDTSKWYCRVVDEDGVACGTVTARKTGCREHIKHHHLDVVPFKCMWPLCDQSFVRKNDIDRHCSTNHHRLVDFPCLECGKVCARKDALKRHMTKAHPEIAAAMEAAAPSKKRAKRGP